MPYKKVVSVKIVTAKSMKSPCVASWCEHIGTSVVESWAAKVKLHNIALKIVFVWELLIVACQQGFILIHLNS